LTNKQDDHEIKLCCATFYQSDLVRAFLGDILHPGGLELTRYLGMVLGLNTIDRVLDIASGRGASAVHLAKHFGCHVTGLDYGTENIAAAEAHAAAQGVSHLTSFHQGDAESLPFDDHTFDAVISECSFCTFPDKKKAAEEMARVLSRDGRLGLTDITLSGALPEELQSVLAWVACISGACTPGEYISILQEAGFTILTNEDQRDALLQLIKDVRQKLLVVEIAIGLGKLDLGGMDLGDAKRLLDQGVELIENGQIGYTLITASKNKV